MGLENMVDGPKEWAWACGLKGQSMVLGLGAFISSNWAKTKQNGPNLTSGPLMDENPLKLGLN